MLFPVYTTRQTHFALYVTGVIFTCKYFKFGFNTTDLSLFNEKQFVQTHGIAMWTKMAVAFSVIFMADLEKRLLAASPLKPLVWKRFIDDIFSLWNIPREEVSIFVNSLTRSTLRPSLLVKCHPNALFFSIQRYSKDLAFHLLESSIHKPILSPLKLFSIHTSHLATLSIRKRALSKEKHYVF